jgi:acetyl esterase/lipase
MNVVLMLRSTESIMAALGTQLATDERVTTENRTIAGPEPGTDLGLRIYTPKGLESPAPVIVYFHGGAFILGDTYTEEERCLRMAADAGCVVVSVDYRLAPEHPFPAGVEDCYAALEWTAENAGDLGADARRIGVGGSSAGGALAAAVALIARDRHGPAISFQMLIYPVIDDRMTTFSMRTSDATALFCNADAVVMWQHYLGDAEDEVSCYAAPGRARDLSGLPRAWVLVAELDPLRDEGIEYAQRLMQAGVPTELHCFSGACHGFDLIAPRSQVGRRALEEQVFALRRALG